MVDVMMELSPAFRSVVAPPKMKPFELTSGSELMAKPMRLMVDRSPAAITKSVSAGSENNIEPPMDRSGSIPVSPTISACLVSMLVASFQK